ncbi:MAG: hypothetical protein A2W91_13010 [Bacteroidetes bacterium GWF2_38_335]|nr:MAG: hypothetical protein A2W91_13010 [Bacteroidetes bacterium GWF2_38_335]HBS85825.1 hypothetical protein [Bacteroidales bacterium]
MRKQNLALVILPLISVIFFQSQLFCQTKEFLILKTNDTIYGHTLAHDWIADRYCQTVNFFNEETGIKEYWADSIVGYYNGLSYYEACWVDWDYHFCRVIISGEISLLKKGIYEEDVVYDNGSSTGSIFIPKVIYYLKRNGVYTPIIRKKFHKNMAYYFSEDSEIYSKIINRSLGFRNINQIVEVFNKHYYENKKIEN